MQATALQNVWLFVAVAKGIQLYVFCTILLYIEEKPLFSEA